MALTTRSLIATGVSGLAPFACNIALTPYSLFCPVAVWLGQHRSRGAVLRGAGHMMVFVAVAAAALTWQHLEFIELNFFRKGDFSGYYEAYVHFPSDTSKLRALSFHFFGYSVVAGDVLAQSTTASDAAFWGSEWPAFSALGWMLEGIWLLLLVAATLQLLVLPTQRYLRRKAASSSAASRMKPAPLRHSSACATEVVRTDRARHGVTLLCVGWLAGAFCFFCFFGDEPFLPSAFWVPHLFLWAGVGARPGNAHWLPPMLRRTATTMALALFALFVVHQVGFIERLCGLYRPGPLLVR